MIVPRERLLLWAALTLPFAAFGAAVPAGTTLPVAYMLALALVAVVDAMQARVSLRGIMTKLPEVVRLSKDRAGIIPVQINNEGMKGRALRVGLPFPGEIRSSQESFDVALPEGAADSRFNWPCTADTRGNYPIQRCYLETPSPLGFWNIRKSVPTHCEIRVYPNLFDERKRLAAFFLNRGNFGIHAQRMMGQGREFEKLREYIPGDSYDQIHWKATAKRGRPVTKVFQIERTQEVYVILDASRLSAKTLNGETTLEHFIIAALVMGLVAEQQSDLFGLLAFNDRVGSFVRAKNGKAHYHACRDALYTLQPKIVTPDFEEVCSFIRLRLRRRALLVFLTDLSDPVLAESFARGIDLICRQHLIVVGMVKPELAGPLFQTSEADRLDGVYQKLGAHLLWRHLRELSQSLQRHGVRLLQLSDDQLSAQLVSEYLRVKQRQLL